MTVREVSALRDSCHSGQDPAEDERAPGFIEPHGHIEPAEAKLYKPPQPPAGTKGNTEVQPLPGLGPTAETHPVLVQPQNLTCPSGDLGLEQTHFLLICI